MAATPEALASKVLVAVGGQKVDTETIRLACQMVAKGGKLYAVHIIEVTRALPLGSPMEHEVDQGDRILNGAEQIAGEAQVNVETELVQARDTGPAICSEAQEWGADLIVLGLPYKKRFGEFNLGKTVPFVLKNASCRVVLVREPGQG